jgi:hypothetical protein
MDFIYGLSTFLIIEIKRSNKIMKKAFIFSDKRSVVSYCRHLLLESVKNEGSRIYFHADGSKFVSHNTDKPIYFVRYMFGSTRFYREFLSYEELVFEVDGPGYAFDDITIACYRFLCELFGVSFSISHLFTEETCAKLEEVIQVYYDKKYEQVTMFPDSNRVELEDVFDGFDALPTFYCNGYCLTGPAGTGKSKLFDNLV